MANRQQRRHPEVTQLPGPAPMMLQRLKEPEVAADLSVLEAKEITARNDEIEFVRAQAEHFARLLTLTSSEKSQFIRALCTSKGLSVSDEFTCDLERGVILRTAIQVPLNQQTVEIPVATDAPFVEEPQTELPS